MSVSNFNKKYLEILSTIKENNLISEENEESNVSVKETIEKILEKGNAKIKIKEEDVGMREMRNNGLEYRVKTKINKIKGHLIVHMSYEQDKDITVSFEPENAGADSVLNVDKYIDEYDELGSILEYLNEYVCNDLLDEVDYSKHVKSIDDIKLRFTIQCKNDDKADGAIIKFTSAFDDQCHTTKISCHMGDVSAPKIDNKPTKQWIGESSLRDALLQVVTEAAKIYIEGDEGDEDDYDDYDDYDE